MDNETQYQIRQRTRGKRFAKPLPISKQQAESVSTFHRFMDKHAGSEVCYLRTDKSNTFAERNMARKAALAILRRLKEIGEAPGAYSLKVEPAPNPDGGDNLWMLWGRKVNRSNGGTGKLRADANAL